MECDNPDCYTEMNTKIDDVAKCAKGKIGFQSFGIVIGSFAVLVFGYLLGLTAAVGGCADQTDLVALQLQMVKSVEQIQSSVRENATVFQEYVQRTEKRNNQQEIDIKNLCNEVNKIKRKTNID